MTFPANIDLSDLGGVSGFRLIGAAAGDASGVSVASAGDVNGDGFADLIIGAQWADANGFDSGASYVVFGKSGLGPNRFERRLDLASLDGSDGFKLSGVGLFAYSGRSVASAGDVNGDGFADLIIGAPGANPHGSASGASYVVFGQASGFAANLDLASLDGSNGFKLSGAATADQSGRSVTSAGDVNGDGFDDLIVGARYADPNGSQSGASYVVFGQASGFAANLDLGSLDGSDGFKLSGAAAGDQSGFSVASAGDVNGDGFDDLIIGAPRADANGTDSGASYVVFGQASGFAANLDLGSLDGSGGFKLSGAAAGDQSGFSVASAGDVNGDGFADLIVGARYADPNGSQSGASYVVFGTGSGFAANLDLSSLDGSDGFKLSGVATGDQSGFSVAAAGDVNGDGFADLIVGAPLADPHGGNSGASYVVFGQASGFAANLDLASLDGSDGFKLSGPQTGYDSGYSVAAAGDVNGDGFADLIVGAPGATDMAYGNRNQSGESFVVFGGAFGATVTTTGTSAAEMLIGGSGDDTLTGGGGQDAFHGGAGDDELVISDLTFRLADGGTGSDTLVLDGTGLSLDLTDRAVAVKLEGIERIDLGGSGNNTLVIDRLAVLDGLGTVTAGKHVLVVEGDAGDTLSFSEGQWTKVGSFTDGASSFDRYVFGDGEVDVEQGVGVPGATIRGTSGNDTITISQTVAGQPFATNRNDIIRGGAGNDTIGGGAGNDTIDGGADVDVMAGGTGNDIYFVDSLADQAIEAADEGNDTIYAYVGYTLDAGQEIEALRARSDAGLALTGNEFANAIVGRAGNDTLNGEAGNDRLSGGAGMDDMAGDTGNDIYYADDVADQVTEAVGEGTDTVYTTTSYTLGAEQEIEALRALSDAGLALTGNEFANTVVGRAGNDTLNGGAGNDRLNGGAGVDDMAGGTGNDIYYVDDVADQVTEAVGKGTDTVYTTTSCTLDAEQEIEALRALSDAGLALTGNELANTVVGRAGNDTLNGGAGNDTVAGGAGADTFVLDLGSGNDIIRDFAPVIDHIDLTAYHFTDFEALMASASNVGTRVVIALGGDNSLTLAGVQTSQLHAGDFILS